jgi:hypothetical protein
MVPGGPFQLLPALRRPAIAAPREVHLHFHGVSAEDLATILAQQGMPPIPLARPGGPQAAR